MLARIIEAAGIPTVIVTMMPALADKFHATRTLGVEFPFGHPFGMPHDSEMQRAVALAALALYERPPAQPNPRNPSPHPHGVTFAERARPMGYTPPSLFRRLNTEPGFHAGLQKAQT